MPTMQRTPQWLVRALGLLAGDASSTLDRTTLPVVDIHQGGAGQASWTFETATIPTSAVVVVTTLLAADKNLHRLVQLSIVKQGAAGTIDFRLFTDGPSGSTASLTWLELLAYAPGDNISWATIGNGQRYLSIPPGFTLKLRTGAMTAPDAVTVRMIVCTTAAGSKIW